MSEKLSSKGFKRPKSATFVVEVIQPDADDVAHRQYIIRDMRTGVPLLTTKEPIVLSAFFSESEI